MEWYSSFSSSNIARIAYEGGTLLTQFHDGSVYANENVPLDLWIDFLSAGSKGKFRHAHLRGKYGDHNVSPATGKSRRKG